MKKKRNRFKIFVNGFKLVYTCHVMNGKFGGLQPNFVHEIFRYNIYVS